MILQSQLIDGVIFSLSANSWDSTGSTQTRMMVTSLTVLTLSIFSGTWLTKRTAKSQASMKTSTQLSLWISITPHRLWTSWKTTEKSLRQSILFQLPMVSEERSLLDQSSTPSKMQSLCLRWAMTIGWHLTLIKIAFGYLKLTKWLLKFNLRRSAETTVWLALSQLMLWEIPYWLLHTRKWTLPKSLLTCSNPVIILLAHLSFTFGLKTFWISPRRNWIHSKWLTVVLWCTSMSKVPLKACHSAHRMKFIKTDIAKNVMVLEMVQFTSSKTLVCLAMICLTMISLAMVQALNNPFLLVWIINSKLLTTCARPHFSLAIFLLASALMVSTQQSVKRKSMWTPPVMSLSHQAHITTASCLMLWWAHHSSLFATTCIRATQSVQHLVPHLSTSFTSLNQFCIGKLMGGSPWFWITWQNQPIIPVSLDLTADLKVLPAGLYTGQFWQSVSLRLLTHSIQPLLVAIIPLLPALVPPTHLEEWLTRILFLPVC